jgi:hypothetical protein
MKIQKMLAVALSIAAMSCGGAFAQNGTSKIDGVSAS